MSTNVQQTEPMTHGSVIRNIGGWIGQGAPAPEAINFQGHGLAGQDGDLIMSMTFGPADDARTWGGILGKASESRSILRDYVRVTVFADYGGWHVQLSGREPIPTCRWIQGCSEPVEKLNGPLDLCPLHLVEAQRQVMLPAGVEPEPHLVLTEGQVAGVFDKPVGVLVGTPEQIAGALKAGAVPVVDEDDEEKPDLIDRDGDRWVGIGDGFYQQRGSESGHLWGTPRTQTDIGGKYGPLTAVPALPVEHEPECEDVEQLPQRTPGAELDANPVPDEAGPNPAGYNRRRNHDDDNDQDDQDDTDDGAPMPFYDDPIVVHFGDRWMKIPRIERIRVINAIREAKSENREVWERLYEAASGRVESASVTR